MFTIFFFFLVINCSRKASVEGHPNYRDSDNLLQPNTVYSFSIEECILQSHSNHHVHCPVHNDIHLAQVAPDTVLCARFPTLYIIFAVDYPNDGFSVIHLLDVYGLGRAQSDQWSKPEERADAWTWSFWFCLSGYCQREWIL